MKYYVYALNEKLQMIVAALSCPDEKTGKRAYMIACQHLAWDLDDLLRGVISVDACATISMSNATGEGMTELDFGADDFEFAETKTRERISAGSTGEWHDDFMRAVDIALKGLTGNIGLEKYPLSITEEEFINIVRTELFPKFEHEVEDTISGIFSKNNGYPMTNPQSDSNVGCQMQVANGNGLQTSAMAVYKDSIEWNDEPAHVNVSGITPVAENRIENAVYRGTYRAMSRFREPADEVEIEKVHRLRGENRPWKYIAQQVYFDRKGVTLPDGKLNNEVKRLQSQHRREYPKSCKKAK